MATTTSPPILIWVPGGGVPGTPVSNPPVYSQSDVTYLIEGQSYVDVVFGSLQSNTDWVLVACEVYNTLDLAPLNIWPGIITDKTTAGFRLQLNGLPDSTNYYLQWAVSGINAALSPATTYLFTGPTSGAFGVDKTFTVKLGASTTLGVPITITPDDGGAGGSFSPPTVILSNGTATATFTYTAADYGAATLSVTNSGTLTDPAPIIFTSIAPVYTFSGPTGGDSGVASTNFTVLLAGEAVLAVPTTITPSAGGGGGTFTPTTVMLVAGVGQHFTYTPSSAGVKTISVTNDGGLANPASIGYTVTAPFDPSSVAGLKMWLKADSMALADGTGITAWNDSSSNAYNLTSGTATFKTNIVNGKPVVRFNGTSNRLYTAANIGLGAAGYEVFIVGKGDVNTVFIRTTNVTLPVVFYLSTGGQFSVYAGANAVGPTDHRNAFHVFDGLAPISSTAYSFVDGAAEMVAVASGANAMDVINLMYDNVSTYSAGDIAEILIYDFTLLTGPNRTDITNYLKTKYGIP